MGENGAYLQFITICGYSILNGKGDQGNNRLELGGYAPMVRPNGLVMLFHFGSPTILGTDFDPQPLENDSFFKRSP